MTKKSSVNLFLLLLSILFAFCNAEGKTYEALDANNKLIKDVSVWGILKQMFVAEWEQNRLEFLASGIADQSEGMNSTVVATQHIYDDNGNVKEIKTLELTFPKSTNPVKGEMNILDDSSEDEENYQHYTKKLAAVLDTFDTLTLTGMPMHMTFEHYNEEKDGKLDSYVFLAHNFIGGYHEGVGFINQTIEINNRSIMEDYVIEISKKEDAIPIAFLSYDVDGKFTPDRSSILNVEADYGEQLIIVTHMEIDDNRMLVTATRAFTKAVYESPDTMKEDLVAAMKKEFPNYVWFVVTGEGGDGFDLDDHVFITMKKDPIRLHEEDKPITLAGVKINDTS